MTAHTRELKELTLKCLFFAMYSKIHSVGSRHASFYNIKSNNALSVVSGTVRAVQAASRPKQYPMLTAGQRDVVTIVFSRASWH